MLRRLSKSDTKDIIGFVQSRSTLGDAEAFAIADKQKLLKTGAIPVNQTKMMMMMLTEELRRLQPTRPLGVLKDSKGEGRIVSLRTAEANSKAATKRLQKKYCTTQFDLTTKEISVSCTI